jgi:hypothetical protein
MPNQEDPLTDKFVEKVVLNAFELLGDGQGEEWWASPEHTRGILELVDDLIGLDHDDREQHLRRLYIKYALIHEGP